MASGAGVTIAEVTIALAITVVLLAAGLVYLLVSRHVEPVEQPDFASAVQEAASRAVADALPGLLQANDEARKLDAKTAEAALDKRQAEIKALAERIAKGQEKIEKEVQRRGETDLQTRALIEQVGQTIGNLNAETAGLKKALRQPQTRGQWGELQLRRCVEIAGMTEHVDFEVQETLRSEEGRLRPDARFLLPEDLVICFIPNEPALHAAFGADPELFDYALERNVLLVSPTSLIGLLRTMELGWRQERMVAEAAEIAEAAGTLHSRFAKFLSDFNKVGRGLTTAATAYDSAVGSMERRLLPQLRKVEDLGVAPGKEIEPPEPTEITVRAITAPELRETSDAT